MSGAAPRVDLKALGAQILHYALVMADDTARSDIECFAKCGNDGDGRWIYSLTETIALRDTLPASTRGAAQFVHSLEEAAENLRVVQRAAAYIRLRGDVWRWRMVEIESMPGWVRFVEKDHG